MASNFTPYTIIQNIADRFLPESLKEKALWDFEDVEYAKQGYKAPLQQFPLEQYGNNLIAAPNMYLEEGAIKDVKINPNLPFETGGTTSLLSGIELNNQSNFRPLNALIHEMQHYKDMFRDYTNNIPKNAVNIKELSELNKARTKNIQKNFIQYVQGNPADKIAALTITGQEEPDEIIAQLKSYEAMLPAGMNIFQSPVGKKLFKTDEDKLWWLSNTTSSMSKFSFNEKKK